MGGFFSNASRTSFAWALTAGFDYDLAPNLKLELSYRYLNLGSIAVGGAHCFAGVQACLGGAGVAASSHTTLASNDLRVGLIWLIGEPQPRRGRSSPATDDPGAPHSPAAGSKQRPSYPCIRPSRDFSFPDAT